MSELTDDDANASAKPEGQRTIRKLNEYKARNKATKKKNSLIELRYWGPSPALDGNLPPVSVCWSAMIL